MEHLKLHQSASGLPSELRKKFVGLVGVSSGEPPPKKANITKKKWQICQTKKDRETEYTCESCNRHVYLENIVHICADCSNDRDAG